MANKEHLVLIRQGVDAWNAWRKVNANIHPDLSGANLSGIYLNGANLNGANFNGANLKGGNFSRANLRGGNLRGSNFSGTDLRRTDLSQADLSGSDISGARLNVANLSGANLSKADLSKANLTRTNLSKADLIETVFLETIAVTTLFVDVDLSTARDLETVRHNGPSSISTDTLIRSQGKIPEVFLRGCGVPESMIEYLPSLLSAMQPIQFYSCFISYSTKDQDFAQRLYERMQSYRLRVWFAPEEMKAGQKIHEQIDQAIRVHDKLVLVLSEQSIQSEWVITEIRKARKAELRDNRRKLFPIGLIDFNTLRDWECFDADSGKDLAVEIREYFIPDFTNWKDHDAFEANFARLLRDLKAAT